MTKPKSYLHKARIAAALRGRKRKPLSDETKAKISAALAAKRDERAAKIRRGLKTFWINRLNLDDLSGPRHYVHGNQARSDMMKAVWMAKSDEERQAWLDKIKAGREKAWASGAQKGRTYKGYASPGSGTSAMRLAAQRREARVFTDEAFGTRRAFQLLHRDENSIMKDLAAQAEALKAGLDIRPYSPPPVVKETAPRRPPPGIAPVDADFLDQLDRPSNSAKPAREKPYINEQVRAPRDPKPQNGLADLLADLD